MGPGAGWNTGGGNVGDAVPASPTRTSPVTCGLAGLGGGELRRWVTGEGGCCWGGADDGGGVGGRVGGCWVRTGLVGGGGAAEVNKVEGGALNYP